MASDSHPSVATAHAPGRRRVLLLGASGTIGRATALALVARGHDAVCFLQSGGGEGGRTAPEDLARQLPGAIVRSGKLDDADSWARDAFRGESFDAVISCLASRSGTPRDAWAVDHALQGVALVAARDAGVPHFVLLSALCVQKPRLAFQQAKLAFERELAGSGLHWTIVRPTAFFKSLSGQVERVMRGSPFLVFGDGRLTACKPISDRDLANFLVGCLDDPARRDRILPIGGPGPAITPRQQGERLFELLGRPPRFRQVPPRLLDVVVGALAFAGRFLPKLADKAELARIGRYYATESMLVLDPATGRYDADATPSTGSDTLFDYYARLVAGEAPPDRGAHKVF